MPCKYGNVSTLKREQLLSVLNKCSVLLISKYFGMPLQENLLLPLKSIAKILAGILNRIKRLVIIPLSSI